MKTELYSISPREKGRERRRGEHINSNLTGHVPLIEIVEIV